MLTSTDVNGTMNTNSMLLAKLQEQLPCHRLDQC